MSIKKNFYLDIETFTGTGNDVNKSGAVASALKYSSDNIDDFIRFVKGSFEKVTGSSHAPNFNELVSGGGLSHNLFVDCGCVKSFFGKGTNASILDGLLKIDPPTASIDLSEVAGLTYNIRPNDFNADTLCIDLSLREETRYE